MYIQIILDEAIVGKFNEPFGLFVPSAELPCSIHVTLSRDCVMFAIQTRGNNDFC